MGRIMPPSPCGVGLETVSGEVGQDGKPQCGMNLTTGNTEPLAKQNQDPQHCPGSLSHYHTVAAATLAAVASVTPAAADADATAAVLIIACICLQCLGSPPTCHLTSIVHHPIIVHHWCPPAGSHSHALPVLLSPWFVSVSDRLLIYLW